MTKTKTYALLQSASSDDPNADDPNAAVDSRGDTRTEKVCMETYILTSVMGVVIPVVRFQLQLWVPAA